MADQLAALHDSAIHSLAFGPERRPLGEIPEEVLTDNDVLSLVLLMLQSAGVSIRSLRHLISCDEMSVRDCFSIARSICEISVNAAFLIAEGPDAGQKAVHHTMARLYREGNRNLTLAGLDISLKRNAEIRLDDFPGLEKALRLYTKKKGTDTPNWTPESIDQRINRVHIFCKNGGQALAVSRFMIYRHSSEILHGSFYGVYYFWTAAGSKPTSSDHSRRIMQSHVLECMSSAFLASRGLFCTLNQKHGLLNEVTVSRQMMSELQDIVMHSVTIEPSLEI